MAGILMDRIGILSLAHRHHPRRTTRRARAELGKCTLTLVFARSETRDPREFLLFLADVLDDAKEGVTTELQQSLISSERRKAELEALTARSTATSNAEKKWAEAETALGEYTDVADRKPPEALRIRQEKAVAVRALQRESNVLAKTAGLPPYYPSLLAIPTE